MSFKRPAANDERAPVIVARAVRVRGLRGEIVAEMLTDFPERFAQTKQLIVVRAGVETQQIELEKHFFQKDRVVLKFAGVDTIEAAQAFIGCEFGVPEREAVALPADEYYDWQLEGCRVETLAGVGLGIVREVLHTGGVPVLLIADDAEREHLVPLAKAICTEVDTGSKLIRIDPPEGLLESDQPNRTLDPSVH